MDRLKTNAVSFVHDGHMLIQRLVQAGMHVYYSRKLSFVMNNYEGI